MNRERVDPLPKWDFSHTRTREKTQVEDRRESEAKNRISNTLNRRQNRRVPCVMWNSIAFPTCNENIRTQTKPS